MKKQTINLNGEQVIVVETDGKGGGHMTAIGLREACRYCGKVECERTCDGQALPANEFREDIAKEEARLMSNAALHGVESLILALACAGFKIEGKRFKKAVETALDAIGNHYGD